MPTENGITAVILLGEVAKTVLFFGDQFIYTYVCTGDISGINKNHPDNRALLDPMLEPLPFGFYCASTRRYGLVSETRGTHGLH